MAKQRRNYTNGEPDRSRRREAEAVGRIAAQGKSLAEVARELGLGESLLRSWKVALAAQGEQAFPGKGNPPTGDEELRRLRMENQQLRHGTRDFKKSDGLLRQGVVMRYQFIQEARHHQQWPTRLMCRTSGGFHRRLLRVATPPRWPHSKATRQALVAEIRTIHHEVKARYGSPRIHAELVARGHRCSVNTVAKLMSQAGVRRRPRRSGSSAAPPTPNMGSPSPRTSSSRAGVAAANSTHRHLGTQPVWTADITYIPPARVGSTWRSWRTFIRGRSSAGR